MRAHINYFAYLLKHKYLVFLKGRELGLPILQLLMHDYSKFSPDEWLAGVDYNAGGKGSQIMLEKHHKRNRHHPQYWVKNGVAKPMPKHYRLEMIADWHAMDILKNDLSFDWYYREGYKLPFHPETRAWVEAYLAESLRDQSSL